MKSCVVQCHYAGLFSLINKVALCHTLYDHVHVDMSQGEGFIYGKENWWPLLFAPTVPPEGEHDTIFHYPDHRITGREAGNAYLSEDSIKWRNQFHESWYKMRVDNDLELHAEFYAASAERDIVGALIRCNGHRGEQLSDKTQSLDEYATAFEKIKKPDSILHVMGDYESLRWFQARFATTFFGYNRNATRDDDKHMTTPQTIEDAKACLKEVLVLSKCRALIHPVSNMATAALYINPELESVYLR